jgi:Zn-finger nucleic acid-binding protein
VNCPRCQLALTEVALPECKVATCAGCEGTWYPGEALADVTDQSLGQLYRGPLQPTLVADRLETVDLAEPISCPVCARPMMRYRYTDHCEVVLDECGQHGVWLDDGELGTLMAYLETLQEGVDALQDQLMEEDDRSSNLPLLEQLCRSQAPGGAVGAGVLSTLQQMHQRPR